MRTISSPRGRWGIALLLGGLASIYGQSTLTVSPTPVFLNAVSNGGPVSVSVAVLGSPGATVTLATPAVPWLTLSTQSATVPATVTFTANPAGMSPGVYGTSVTISDASGVTAAVPVAMTVNASGSTVSAAPGSLVFNFAQGAGAPGAQPLSISATAAVSYSLSASANWITLSAGSGQASPGNSGSVQVGVNPAALGGPGVYTGSVTIQPAGGVAVIVPVVFQFTATAQLSASVSSLTFNLAAAGSLTAQKTISLTSSGAPISFGAIGSTITTSNGAQWLSVSPTVSTTPATLNVTVNGSALPTGQYQGSVNIGATDASGASLKIPVTLVLSAQPLLDVNPTSLSFSYSAGGPLPAHQLVTPNTTVPGQPYTVAVSTNGNGAWLQATGAGQTPNPVDVSVNPAGLGAGTYTGTVTITAPNTANSPQSVNVTLTVTNNPTLTSPNATAGLTFNFEIGQGAPAPQQTSVTSTSGVPLAFTVGTTQTNTSNNVTWLLASSPSSSVTPASFSVAVNPAGMGAGRYTGAVVVNSPGGTPLAIPVTLNVTNAGSPLVNANPSSVTFNAAPGAAVNPQTVTVTSTGEPVSYTVSAAVNSPPGGTWLAVGQPGGPATIGATSSFFISATTAGLAPGTYTATVTVQPANGNPGAVIPVTLSISGGTLSVSPGTLTFGQTFGGAAPAAQTINVSSSGTPVGFSAAVTGGTWLTVAPAAGTTPASLAVTVNGGALQPGNYTAQVVVTAPGAVNGQQTVTVNLTVAAAQSLIVSPAALSFNSNAGSTAPPAQTVTLSTSAGSLPFNAAAAVISPGGVNWLSVSPAAGTATAFPTVLSVSVNPQGLAAGTYSGAVTVTSPNLPGATQTVTVTYTVTGAPAPVLGAIVNGASLLPGPVAPGEILTINGSNLGPVTPVAPAQVPGAVLPVTVSGTQVTFDGIPAPLTSVSSVQVKIVVPYAIAGRALTQLVVSVNGSASQPIVLNVATSSPAIFLDNLPGFPASQGAIGNDDGSVNSPSSPAPRGRAVVIFATGEGSTSPPGTDGLITPFDPNALKNPVLSVQVFIGGQPADVQYAGSAPGFVQGALQINAVVPDGAPTGPAIPIFIQVGDNRSPDGVTMAVQ
jgi:uncharacterized protein (TIGR03437 family)